MLVGKVSTPAAADKNLTSGLFAHVDDHHIAPTIPCLCSAHKPRSASAYNQYIDLLHHLNPHQHKDAL